MAQTSTSPADESGATRPPAAPQTLAKFEIGPVLGIAALAGASMILFATRYGYHSDELYYVASGEHLAAGYVDHPPITPVVAHLVDLAFGHSLLAMRSVAAVVVMLGVVATALLAREFGARRTGQTLAAFTIAASPVLRGHNLFLGTTGLDQLMWAAVLLAVARLLRTRDPRWWIAVGLAFGIGLETKSTIVVLAAALVVGILADRRKELLWSGWFVGGVAIALVLWAPNLAWNATHQWAMIEFGTAKQSPMTDISQHAYFLVGQLLMSGLTTVVVWVPGWRWLLDKKGPGHPFRALGLAAIAAEIILLLTRAKYYYAGPIFILLFAAGAVALEAVGRRERVFATVMVALSIILCAPLTMPLLPAGNLTSLELLNRDYPAMIGWPELAGQVQAISDGLSPEERTNTVVLTANYGEAAAIQHFAPGLPVYSAHNSYWMWGPPPDSATNAIVVGYGPQSVERVCRSPVRVGTVANDAGLENFEHGRTIWFCRGLTGPWSQLWPALRDYG